MKKSFQFLTAALLGIAAVACSSPEKMVEQAENVIVTCNPAVLEVIGGVIDADVTVTYPEDYFHPKAILEVTPVIVYDGGEVAMEPYYFQGNKVEDNYEVVPSEGATITKPVHFEYVKGMENCYLELRGVAKYKKDVLDMPSKKAADGAITTYMLVCQKGKAELKADGYQEVIASTAEGQILYNINSSDVQNKQLKSDSIKDFQAAIDEANNNERKTITSTEVIAYASPDGGEELNAKLSDNRAKSAQKAYGKVTKDHKAGNPTVSSKGQDWEGFQGLVSESDIEDKDLILRVLSMYSDPEVREKEIKNMSAVYKTLADDVLPELRRARFIANVEYQNYSGDELLKLVDENIDALDEPALLRAATLVEKTEDKVTLYKKAIEKYDSATAKYNLAVTYINDGKYADAKAQLDALDSSDKDVQNAYGCIALAEGDYKKAAESFKTAGNKENDAAVDILNGDYDAAASKLAGQDGFNAALVQVLKGNYAAAKDAIKCDCPKAAYLKAIIAARQGDADGVKANLEVAKKDDELAKRAEKDVEFALYR